MSFSADGGAVLATLIAVVTALFLATLVFSGYAVALRLRSQARDRRRERFASRWSEPLLSALADPADAASIHLEVREDERLNFVGFTVQYARRLRGEGRDGLQAIARPYLDRVVQRADAPRVEVRARAIQTLGMLGLPDHAARVIAALDDPSPLVAMVAARSLAQKESPEYAAAVLERLSRFQGWNRRFLASMLAAMGPQVASTLRAGLADRSTPPHARAVLAEALILQSDVLAGDVAADIAGAAENRDLTVAALRLLRAVGRPVHAPLVRRLATAADDVVRAQALRALGAVGSEQDVPMLLAAMEDAAPWVALGAARGALEAGARSELLELASSDRPAAALARQVLSEAQAVA
jgi:HEAT repeat protein